MIKIEFRAMGCAMAAFLDDESPAAYELLEQAPGWFEEWEQALSRFRTDSELSRLNADRGRDSASRSASPVLREVIAAALDAAERTGGLVNPTMLDALEQAGYARSFEQMPADGFAVLPRLEVWEQAADRWREIVVDALRGTVRLPAGVRLDLGGIAKGWAAGQAAARLAELAPALVDAGGDIAASGPLRSGAAWPVAVADPQKKLDNLALLAAGLPESRGIATSGIDYRRWRVGSAWMHHIIDPRTAQPAQTDLLTVTATAPDAQQAEAAAKAVLILGSRAGTAWLEDQPGHSALLVHQDGRLLFAGEMQKFLWRPR